MASTTTWFPKYPEFSRNPQNVFVDKESPGDDLTTTAADRSVKPIEWHDAPSTSHLHSFAFVSINPQDPTYDRINALTRTAKIYIRFKPSGREQRIKLYLYSFRSDSEARGIFEKLKSAAHPGAEVVNEILIAEKVQYERIG